MPFDWNEYQTFAEELQATRSDEAAQRSAVSAGNRTESVSNCG